jgi:hypothetical protein
MASGATASPSGPSDSHGFLDEEWLTPMQIARKLGYSTAKPIRKAILSGELKASRSPCRRKLLVTESEVLRWLRRDLAFEPTVQPAGPIRAERQRLTRGRRRSTLPRLSYDVTDRPSV